MTNTVSDAATGLNESQMADIAATLNAIEPGAGTEAVAQAPMLAGFEWMIVVFILCAFGLMSLPSVRSKAGDAWRGFRQAFSRRMCYFKG